MAIDTHETVKELTSAGFSEAQAEALTRAVQAAAQIDLADLATKQDVSLLRHDLAQLEVAIKHEVARVEASTKHELALSEARFDTKLAKQSNDLTWRMVIITATMNAILFAVLHFAH